MIGMSLEPIMAGQEWTMDVCQHPISAFGAENVSAEVVPFVVDKLLPEQSSDCRRGDTVILQTVAQI